MNTTWAMNALRLQKDNTKLAGLLEEALDCIDQYDYEEAFDLVQRIKDAEKLSRTSHPPVVPWGGSSLTEMEELVQKVQQLERRIHALIKDKKRMDWIVRNTQFIEVMAHKEYGNPLRWQICPDRKSIDYAMKEAKP